MNLNYIERKLLSENDIFLIRQLINICEWEDGKKSLAKGSFVGNKKNLEVIPSELRYQISSIIMNALDGDQKFINFCFPKNSSECIVSKMVKNGYYNPHLDSYTCGHFSTTVFISDSDEYEGGELCLYLNGEEKKFKPNSGTAITYHTGILHRVNEVLSGERIVCVLWTNSIIKDDNSRNIVSDLTKSINILEKNNTQSKNNKNFDNVLEDPIFILSNLREQILRNYFM